MSQVWDTYSFCKENKCLKFETLIDFMKRVGVSSLRHILFLWDNDDADEEEEDEAI